MVIAVNTRYWIDGPLEGYGYFAREVSCRLAARHPEHQFHFLFDRVVNATLPLPANVVTHVLSPRPRHTLQWKFWYDVRVPLLLRKVKADLFLSLDGQCSLLTRVPQVLAIHDLGFLQHPEAYRRGHVLYLRRFTPRFVRKASTVLTVSEFSKRDIVAHYKTPEEKIAVVGNGVKEMFRPLAFADRDAVKGRYTEGAEYFLYAGAIHPRKNLVNLLKAFSVFKRRLQSGFKLVLCGRLAWKNDEFLNLLKTYKHREDVVLTGYLPEEELAKLMASAYAFVYPSLFEGFGVPVAEAMRCGVPVLTSRDSAMEEVAGGAALLFDPTDVDEMAGALMRVYKDEGERGRMIEKGLVVAERYSWERTAKNVWKVVEVVAKGSR